LFIDRNLLSQAVVIHCRAGVGRTGQLICSLALDQAPGLSLETVITQMRLQRNAYLVQMDGQLDALVDLWLDDERAGKSPAEQEGTAAPYAAPHQQCSSSTSQVGSSGRYNVMITPLWPVGAAVPSAPM
jgi:hypothetical protein